MNVHAPDDRPQLLRCREAFREIVATLEERESSDGKSALLTQAIETVRARIEELSAAVEQLATAQAR